MLRLSDIVSSTRNGYYPDTEEVITTIRLSVRTVLDTDRARHSKIDMLSEIHKKHAETIWHILYGDISDELHQFRFHLMSGEPSSPEYYWSNDRLTKLLVRLGHPQP